ncbi:MAG: LemA family protein [Spirochaetes bacterium]|nr:LemA family protein [Spirochaetota bacterium]
MTRKRLILMSMLTVAVIAATGCGYNVMQQQEEEVFKAWGDLESALQRRADLIPNLVQTVKGYAKHERETLTAVIEARAKATSVQINPKDLGSAEALQKFQQAQGNLSSALGRLMVVVERYPDLKANEQFRDLMHQLEGTENRINVARTRYNEAVKNFNYSIRSFPYSLTNSILLHLEKKEYFKADEGAKTAPEVKFD